jgi:signal peptidase II
MKKLLIFSSLIVFSVLLVDQATKYYIKAKLGYFDVVTVTSFFNIVYAENTGSAFGMFKSLGAYFFIIVSIAAIIFLAVLIFKDKGNSAAYSLLLGGAAGNLLDRFINGYVVDFLDFHLVHAYVVDLFGYHLTLHHWPAFNVADSALSLGITILLIKTIRDSFWHAHKD